MSNEKYTGVYTYNRSAPKNETGRRNSHAEKQESEIIRLEGAIPAIVSPELYKLVQALLKQRSGQSSKAKEQYVLSGLVRCSICGGRYVGTRRFSGRNKSLQVVYQCSTRKHSKTCYGKEIGRDRLEQAVRIVLANSLFTGKNRKALESSFPSLLECSMRTQTEQADGIRRNLSEIDKEIDALVGFITKTKVELSYQVLCDKLEHLEQSKRLAQSNLINAEAGLLARKNRYQDIAPGFQAARLQLIKGTLPAANILVAALVKEIEIHEDSVKIILHPFK